jgi:ketosteroid isomerase-like protein
MRRQLACGFVAALSLFASAAIGQDKPSEVEAMHVLEIRSYTLKTGTRDRFHQTFVHETLPMLRRWKIDVVAYGPSRHDADSYYLMRAFSTVDERQRVEDAFYASEEWRTGPREAVLAPIVTYTTVVVTVDEDTLRGLRRTMHMQNTAANTAASDVETLLALNDDYIRSVQTSDVQRFGRILADDFLASLSDGSLLDRARFLEYTAKPATISNLAAHDVNVRVMGDFAIIHARTTFTLADGRNGEGRYTDVWARRNGRWLAVAAHVTRK